MFKQNFLLLLSIITGCTSNLETNKPINFNYNAVENIEFNLQPLPERKGTSEWTKAISIEISQRFADAGYPIFSSFSTPTQSANHVLEAQVEETRITKTQPGFSLGFGNSNPRSTNFQKTFSAPISCTLRSLDDPTQNISLKELKSVSSPFDNIGSSQEKINAKLNRFYIENIGSTCHNLLNKLQVKRSSLVKSDSSNKNTFSRAMRIETKYKSDKNKRLEIKPSNEVKDIKTIETKIGTKKKIKDEVIKNTQTEAKKEVKAEANKEIERQTSKEVAEKDNFPAVTTDEKNTHDWRDAEITIFNQGDTVILEFGNNR